MSFSPAGKGWPNAAEPGVPGLALDDGFHWMRWPGEGGATQIGQWCPDLWLWVVSYLGVATPDEMAHLDYIQPAEIPIAARSLVERP